MGAERVDCEHVQVLMANLLQKLWEWQENRKEAVIHGAHRYNTMDVARQDGISIWPSQV